MPPASRLRARQRATPAKAASRTAAAPRAPRAGRRATEHQEQAALFAWAATREHQWPDLHWMHAIPNGGPRSAVTGALLKAEGVRAGVPDICLPAPRYGWHGLYIEMKRPKGAKPRATQQAWLEYLLRAGYRVTWCRGWDDAREVLREYLALPPWGAL